MAMKKFAYFLFALLLTSCQLKEINENPNVPTDVPMETLLPTAEYNFARAIGGRTFTYSNIFSQHLEGTNNQELNTENYNPDELFVGNLWDDYYAGFMLNLRLIIEKAESETSPHYGGVAKVLMANALGNLTSIWGDVPYREALLGSENLQSVFDPQEQLYADIQLLLDEAIRDLREAKSTFSPGADDVLYNGDLVAWTKAAYSLKARYHWHLSKRDRAGAIVNVLADLPMAFDDPNDDLAYDWLGTSVDANPIFQYYEITPNSIVDPDFLDLLDSLGDPRRDFFIETIPFTGGLTKVGPALASPDAPTVFISFEEVKFIEAEVEYYLNDLPAANAAAEAAVRASFDKASGGTLTDSAITAYVQQHAFISSTLSPPTAYLTQKYIALFTQLEPWTDYRRTGLPALTPNPGGSTASNPGGAIPRRLIYPQSERIANPNTPSPVPSMQDRFWWDQ